MQPYTEEAWRGVWLTTEHTCRKPPPFPEIVGAIVRQKRFKVYTQIRQGCTNQLQFFMDTTEWRQ